MAIGKGSDFKIYQEEFFGGMSEVLEQNANGFNAASAGALRLVPRRLKGEYEKESFIKSISGLVSRRDVTSVSSATDLGMTQGEIVGVKINRKIGPVANTLDSFRKIARDPQEFSFLLGQQWGQAVAVDYINTAISAVEAALSGVAALNYDATGETIKTLTHSHLVNGMAKMGDAANRITCWVMHSKNYFDLVNQSIADKVFEVAGATIYSGSVPTLGKPVLVTDSAALWDLNGSATDTYNVLGLVDGAVEIAESEDREIVSDLVTGLENLVLRIQGEYAFNLRVNGFAWDVTNGGANPTDTAIGTSTNWDQAYTDVKALAGVRVKVQ